MEKDQLTPKLVVTLHADVVDSISKYHGRVHELHGDAQLAEFKRASDAIHWFFSRRLAQR